MADDTKKYPIAHFICHRCGIQNNIYRLDVDGGTCDYCLQEHVFVGPQWSQRRVVTKDSRSSLKSEERQKRVRSSCRPYRSLNCAAWPRRCSRGCRSLTKNAS
jgi:hypothetical protein